MFCCALCFIGYTGHWGHQFGDGSSQRLLCPGTDKHSIQKPAFLRAVHSAVRKENPSDMSTFMKMYLEGATNH